MPKPWQRDSRRVPFLLKGLVFGPDGRALTPWFTRKKSGRLYRHYLPARANQEHAGASGLPRAYRQPSSRRWCWNSCVASCGMVADVVIRAVELDPTLDEAQVTVAMTRLDAIWDQLFPAEPQRIVRILVEKVVVSPAGYRGQAAGEWRRGTGA